MELNELVRVSSEVAATRSRRQKVEALASCLASLGADEIEIAASFLAGSLPQGRIGIGPATVRSVVGDVSPAANASLSVRDVDAALTAIREARGAGSAGLRRTELAGLLGRATAAEQRFLVGLVLGEVRQGALDGILIDAIARVADAPVGAVRRAAMFAGEVPPVAAAALTEGESGLARFGLELFRPVLPMLAQPIDGIDAALARHERAAFEIKLDGVRVQVHRAGGDVRVFTRSLNDVTAAVPEVVDAVRALPAHDIILDGEVIALREDGSPLPFQTTMRRFGRKLDIDRLRVEVPLSTVYFDCLHLDGDSLVDVPDAQRRRVLEDRVPESLVIPRFVSDDAVDASRFLDGTLSRGHEGLMVKALDAVYEAGGRGHAWLKIKPVHTLDLVVLAAEWGSGRREGFLSNLHLGARDAAGGEHVMLGKTFKGMTDKMLAWQTEALLALETGRDGHVVHVRPDLVVEIAFNDVQESPQYPGGMALRFARVKGYRCDKSAAEADTIETVRSIYETQRRRSD